MKKIYFFIILSILSAFYINANNVNINNNINEQFSNIKYLSSHFEEYISDSVSDRTRYRADYVGDINAEAQRICFDSKGTYTYTLNTNKNPQADVLDPDIYYGSIGFTYNLYAPTWFYIEPTFPDTLKIQMTKNITSDSGKNLDYICYKVPKTENPQDLANASSYSIIDSDLIMGTGNSFKLTFGPDPDMEYNYVIVIFNMPLNDVSNSPTGNIVFELVEPEIPTELPTQTITINGSTSTTIYGCPSEEYVVALTNATINAN
ncbi:MAG: hypothetical protein IJE76_10075, partial [Bacteroidales bacterium]|nr:hypothetical protein [Bacteroidales bacterium]